MTDPVGYIVAGRDPAGSWWVRSIVWPTRAEADVDHADAVANPEPDDRPLEFIVCAVVPVKGEGRG